MCSGDGSFPLADVSGRCRDALLAGVASTARAWTHLEVTSLTGLHWNLGLAGGPRGGLPMWPGLPGSREVPGHSEL